MQISTNQNYHEQEYLMIDVSDASETQQVEISFLRVRNTTNQHEQKSFSDFRSELVKLRDLIFKSGLYL